MCWSRPRHAATGDGRGELASTLVILVLSVISREVCWFSFVKAVPVTLEVVLSPTPAGKFLFVTSYFRVYAAKHSFFEYDCWIREFLRIFVGELFVYTSKELSQGLFREEKANVHVRNCYESPWDIPCLAGRREPYRQQRRLDPENLTHHRTEMLYAIWNGRTCLVKEVSDEFPSSLVFWIDIGLARLNKFGVKAFPNMTRMEELYGAGTEGRMVFSMVARHRYHRAADLVPITFDWIQGGFYGGDRRAIIAFFANFWAVHDALALKGFFVGKDQILINVVFAYGPNSWVEANFKALPLCNKWLAALLFHTNPEFCFPPGARRLLRSEDFMDGDHSRLLGLVQH